MEKKYDCAQQEKQMQAFWEEQQIYRFDAEHEGEVYSIDTPPPTVSGSLHIGHLFSYTQAEIIARFRRMQGYRVFYPFGFDDNGLPTERLVEREQGVRAGDMTRSAFTALCRQTIPRYEEEFRNLWKSLGFSVDWSLQYETIREDVQKLSQALFLELVEKGRAYQKESPVLWCTECRTSIAQAELSTQEAESTFYTIPFQVGERVLKVATTRPELLYGCVCLFVNPCDERYVKYAGKMARVPLYDYEIPIYADDKVSPEKGTGVVMCATFGDSTDAEWFREHSLPYRKIILPDGTIEKSVPLLGGLTVRAARKEIVRRLLAEGLLLNEERICHAVGVHERCGTEIEIIPSVQWYIDILSQKERLRAAADEIHWYPSYMKERYLAWVDNLKWDWCISRQRYFGVPFPVWYCEDCGRPHFAKPDALPVNPPETPYKETCICGCTQFRPETAVLDTWATSSITPRIHARFGIPASPMSMRTHAHEIIRTWTFYSIVRSLYHTGKVPWKDLMINGFVLAKKGEKISKSKNNASLTPEALIAAHSADALRYWSANARLGTDTFFSPDELTASKRFLTKLWNAARFCISHLEDVEWQEPCELLPADRWILAKTDATIRKAGALLMEYEIGSARKEIDDLFWKDFCDYYIEIVKERLYEPEMHGYANRRSGQRALYSVLLSLLKLYAIYVPHMTESIYQAFFRKHEKAVSLHQLTWSKPDEPNAEILTFGEELKNAVFAMRKFKSEQNLSMRTEMERLTIYTEPRFIDWFAQTAGDLKACAHAKEVEILNKANQTKAE